MKKIFLSFNFSVLILSYSFAQPALQWQKCLGGSGSDLAYSIQQTVDGGYIVAGWTYSNNGDVTGNHGWNDYWVVKLDSSGILQWQKYFGGTSYDEAYSIQQTAEGGYIVAGYSRSNDGDVTGNHGWDYWVVKLDASGNLQWQKCFGGTSYEQAYSIQQTADGGFVIVGYAYSNDGDVTGHHGIGYSDFWLVKLTSAGSIQWQKCFGGTDWDEARSVQQTSDGGYIVAGFTHSNDGDVTGNHSVGYSDCWIVKLDSIGTLEWQKSLGGTDEDIGHSVKQTTDGGYIVAGSTESNDGDVMGLHSSSDTSDYWVVKLDASGILQWQKCFGGTSDDEAYSIQLTIDGGFIVTGYSKSIDGDLICNHIHDYWIVKLDSSGTLQWQKCLGGNANDNALCIQQTTDGGYIVAGSAGSNDGDVTGNHGNLDYWIIKLAPYVGIEEETSNSFLNISPNPFTTQATINFNKEVHNATLSLYNLLGEKVAEVSGINGESYQFNRGNLPGGVYVFEVREGKSIWRGKAVVY